MAEYGIKPYEVGLYSPQELQRCIDRLEDMNHQRG